MRKAHHVFKVTIFLWGFLLLGSYSEVYSQILIQPKAEVKAKTEIKADSLLKTLPNEQQNKLIEQKLKTSADLEIDGLVVDETVTKIGRTFYDIFYMQWEAPLGAKNFSITIKEKPARGNGTIVTVVVNDQNLFEYQLQPRYDIIEEVANYVLSLVYDYLVEDQLNKQLEAEGKNARELY